MYLSIDSYILYQKSKPIELVRLVTENHILKENYSKLIRTKRSETYIKVLNIFHPVIDYLIANNLCPAIFFVFSRAKCETYANLITRCLLTSWEQESVHKTIEAYIYSKLNYKQKYATIDEFQILTKFLSNGIGIHHSGLVPIFKELVEILFHKD